MNSNLRKPVMILLCLGYAASIVVYLTVPIPSRWIWWVLIVGGALLAGRIGDPDASDKRDFLWGIRGYSAINIAIFVIALLISGHIDLPNHGFCFPFLCSGFFNVIVYTVRVFRPDIFHRKITEQD